MNNQIEEIYDEIVGWQIENVGNCEQGFFLNISNGIDKKRVNFFASDLGVAINTVMDLKTNKIIFKHFSDLYFRFLDEIDNEISFLKNNQFVGIEVNNINYLFPLKDININKKFILGDLQRHEIFFKYCDENLFQELVSLIRSNFEIKLDLRQFMQSYMSIEDQIKFIKEKFGEEALAELDTTLLKEFKED